MQALVDCGPRPPGTPEIECARKYIIAPTNTQDIIQFNLEDKLLDFSERITVPPPEEKRPK